MRWLRFPFDSTRGAVASAIAARCTGLTRHVAGRKSGMGAKRGRRLDAGMGVLEVRGNARGVDARFRQQQQKQQKKNQTTKKPKKQKQQQTREPAVPRARRR